jgi:hypothetical protein
MTTQTFGEVNWDSDLDFGRPTGQSKFEGPGKDIWLRLVDGSNPIRIVTRPHQYLTHVRIKREGDRGFGQKVGCSKANGGSCPLCDAGYRATPRWYLGVIDRRTNAFRILDISYMVFQQIRKINKSAWGDPQGFEADLMMDKKAKSPQEYYQFMPIEKKPLSPTDQSIRDQADLEYLKRRVQPPTLEMIQKRLEKIVGDGKLAAPPVSKMGEKATASTKNGKSATPAVLSSDDMDDLDNLFPDADTDDN